jgi:hypothetical protein
MREHGGKGEGGGGVLHAFVAGVLLFLPPQLLDKISQLMDAVDLHRILVGIGDQTSTSPVSLTASPSLQRRGALVSVHVVNDQELEDWRRSSTYSNGYTSASPTVKWFWEALQSAEPARRSAVLEFCTGSKVCPLRGFAALAADAVGLTKPFEICMTTTAAAKAGRTSGAKPLPTASTCFNTLYLPTYTSRELLEQRLWFAVCESRGFAEAAVPIEDWEAAREQRL